MEKASKGIDKVFFTNEEKADYWLKFLKAYEPFKLSQRFLMFIVTLPYVFVWVVCALTFLIASFFDFESAIAASKELAAMNNGTLGTPTAIILSFYFGGGMIEGAISRIREPQSKKGEQWKTEH